MFMEDTLDGRQECKPCPKDKVQPYQGMLFCFDCPSQGVHCMDQTHVNVMRGFYAAANDNITKVEVWKCARFIACEGGIVAGNASCAEGAACFVARAPSSIGIAPNLSRD